VDERGDQNKCQCKSGHGSLLVEKAKYTGSAALDVAGRFSGGGV